eukprot:CAMPEP_0172682720 /NCGR_PEP_ID=MMETSP1074-20121228/18359_1 /TAXON_ID=2916 /ORGANISM="Ceratium fusus, Strain PA161109" /LENGTH=213 /DNA_ID=CAMNT_0013501439 /DNA_START=419 /DNA_END=1058 /DNA_ORIENTATION=+
MSSAVLPRESGVVQLAPSSISISVICMFPCLAADGWGTWSSSFSFSLACSHHQRNRFVPTKYLLIVVSALFAALLPPPDGVLPPQLQLSAPAPPSLSASALLPAGSLPLSISLTFPLAPPGGAAHLFFCPSLLWHATENAPLSGAAVPQPAILAAWVPALAGARYSLVHNNQEGFSLCQFPGGGCHNLVGMPALESRAGRADPSQCPARTLEL